MMIKQTKTEVKTMTNLQTPSPVLGHRCRGARIGFGVACECGFTTITWYGKGARKNAYGEWRSHILEHQAQTKDDQAVLNGGKDDGKVY